MNTARSSSARSAAGRPTLSACARLAAAAVALLFVTAPLLRADMVVSGELRYDDREYDFDGWTGVWSEQPVRLVQVVVVDAATGDLLAEGATDLDGRFSIEVAGSGTRDLVVRGLSICTALAPDAISVVSLSGVPYSMSTPEFADWDMDLDLDVGVSVSEKVLTGSQKGNPFNLLDVIIDGFRYIDAAGLPPVSTVLDIVWPSTIGTAGSLSAVWIDSGDGYDDVVALHELGHSIDFRYSHPEVNGAQHYFGQSDQFPGLSMSEGFASWFAGAMRQWRGDDNPGIYFDGPGNGGAGSFQLRAEYETRKPYKGKTGGEADELAVCAALWNLADTAATTDGDQIDDDPVDGSFLFGGRFTGDRLVLHAMASEGILVADAMHVIALWNALFTDMHCQSYFDALADAFEESKIAVRPDPMEPDSTPEQAIPIVPDSGWSDIRTLVADRAWPPVPGTNDSDHIVFELPALTLFEVETRYPKGKADAETYVDTFVRVSDSEGTLLASGDIGGTGRNARVVAATDTAGSYRAAVSSINPSRATGRYEVRVTTLGPLLAPVIDSVTPTQLVSVPDGYLDAFSLTGENFVGTQSVTLGGVPVKYFYATSDDKLSMQLPMVQVLGEQLIVVSNGAGQSSIMVNITAPDPPAVNAGSGLLYWNWDPVVVKLGSQPFDLVYLFLSGSPLPTSIPGVVELGIGDAGNDLSLLDIVELGPGGTAELEFRRPANLVGVTDFYVQAAVQPAAGPPLPLVPTNVEHGVIEP